MNQDVRKLKGLTWSDSGQQCNKVAGPECMKARRVATEVTEGQSTTNASRMLRRKIQQPAVEWKQRCEEGKMYDVQSPATLIRSNRLIWPGRSSGLLQWSRSSLLSVGFCCHSCLLFIDAMM